MWSKLRRFEFLCAGLGKWPKCPPNCRRRWRKSRNSSKDVALSFCASRRLNGLPAAAFPSLVSWREPAVRNHRVPENSATPQRPVSLWGFIGWAELGHGMWDIIEKRFLTRCLSFSFSTSAAYIGSTIGLFLGCSLLSCTEFIYFFTWRFVKLLFGAEQQKRIAPVQLSLPVTWTDFFVGGSKSY